MRNYSYVRSAAALSLFLIVFIIITAAAASAYSISGKVVDINGNPVPGAKVSLFHQNVQPTTPVYTAESGPGIGQYTFEFGMLSAGEYLVLVEIDGKTSSAMVDVSGYSKDYTVKTIALKDYAVPNSDVITKTSPTVTAAPVASDTVAPPTPTPSATVKPSTPAATPGLVFMFIPALLVFCLISIKKGN